MNGKLPEPHEAQQLFRLRTLRVQRARERCGQAQWEVDAAAHVVRERQRSIERCRRAIDTLSHDVVHALAPRLPRWSSMASAQRERLDDRLERDEYALNDDEYRLEQSQERLQQARAELTRALAREDAVRGLTVEVRRTHALMREQRSERELEDQPHAPSQAQRRHGT